nr:hypothetical protein [Cressdnaviricota sp.]
MRLSFRLKDSTQSLIRARLPACLRPKGQRFFEDYNSPSKASSLRSMVLRTQQGSHFVYSSPFEG